MDNIDLLLLAQQPLPVKAFSKTILSSNAVKSLGKLLILVICKEYYRFSIIDNHYFRAFIK